MAKTKPTHLTIPVDFLESERGNTMLCGDDGCMVAWLKIDDHHFLEISDTPANSPRLYVSVTTQTPAQLRKHVIKNLEGWFVVRWNLPGEAPIDRNDMVVAPKRKAKT